MQSRCIPYANIGIKKDSASYLPRNRLKTVTSHKKKDCRHAIFRHIDSPSLFVTFRESGLLWPKPPVSGFLDIIHNPLPDFRRSVTLPAFYLNSGVRTLASKEAFTALRINAPSSFKSKYSNSMATERIWAKGLAMFCPLACGQEP